MKLARKQWKIYSDALRKMGCKVVVLEAAHELPDSPFVEDTGVVVGDTFFQSRMSLTTRGAEVATVSEYFAKSFSVKKLEAPGTLDGGDVLRMGNHFFVGESSRTNLSGYEQFAHYVEQKGFTSARVPVEGCLHLKTAVTALDEETVLLNPAWVSSEPFHSFRVLTLPESEPFSANVLRLGKNILVASGYPERDKLLQQHEFEFEQVDISELEKAEAGLTCLSIIVS